jgi:hypothetical protein
MLLLEEENASLELLVAEVTLASNETGLEIRAVAGR